VAISPRRSTALLVLSALAVAAALALAVWSDRTRFMRAAGGASIVELRLLPALEKWRTGPRPAGVAGMALFGDSVADCAGDTTLGNVLQAELARGGLETSVVSLTQSALRPLHFYYLLDRVLAGQPRVVVVEVNMRAFSDHWLKDARWRFPELSRWLSVRRALRVREALAAEGLDLFAPPLYRLEAWLGVLYVTPGVRVLGQDVLAAGGSDLNEALGLELRPPVLHSHRSRLDAPLARAWYAHEPAATPTAGVLRAILVELRAAGVAPVFFVAPIDVDRLDELGVRDELALPARLAALRTAVGADDAEWVDLHAALTGADIFDYAGHPHGRGCARLGSPLAAAVLHHPALASGPVAPQVYSAQSTTPR
jgi:hypothetical protein